MMNTMIGTLQRWLKTYLKSRGKNYRSAAGSLLIALEQVETVEALSSILASTFEPDRRCRFFSATQDDFLNVLASLKQQIETRQAMCLGVVGRLNTLNTPGQTVYFIDLLKEMLAAPQFVLHNDALILLTKLENTRVIQQLLIHLAACPQHPGHVSRKEWINNPSYVACLHLLRNNELKKDRFYRINSNYIEAGRLLKTFLTFYEEMQTPIDNLVPVTSQATCILC